MLSYDDLVNENPRYVVLNGKARGLVDTPLQAGTKDRIRMYFGNAGWNVFFGGSKSYLGPNLVSSFHVIGAVFDKVYKEGGMMKRPARGIHVTQVPSGGTACVEFLVPVPGTYTILDHSLSRIEKGCVGFINVEGEKRPGIYHSDEPPTPCLGCKIHP